jgi:hypothetical protein
LVKIASRYGNDLRCYAFHLRNDKLFDIACEILSGSTSGQNQTDGTHRIDGREQISAVRPGVFRLIFTTRCQSGNRISLSFRAIEFGDSVRFLIGLDGVRGGRPLRKRPYLRRVTSISNLMTTTLGISKRMVPRPCRSQTIKATWTTTALESDTQHTGPALQ